MNIISALLPLLLAAVPAENEPAQPKGQVIEEWRTQGWTRLLAPDAPGDMPVTWAQAYWVPQASEDETLGTNLKVQVQFRNDAAKPILSMRVPLLLQHDGLEDYRILGAEWAKNPDEDGIGEHEVMYATWLFPGFAARDLPTLQNVIIFPPCRIVYADGTTWSASVAEGEADYCERLGDTFFPQALDHRTGVVKPEN